MLIVENVILSDDIMDHFFVCNTEKCKGACCVEGDSGAPLTEEECRTLDRIVPEITDFLDEEGLRIIQKQGAYEYDKEGEPGTSMKSGGECVFVTRDEQGKLRCGIEEAWNAGKTDFRKPVSCQLYPIRETGYDEFTALNYHRWDICSPACELGTELRTPLYIFLKDALTRRFGDVWYAKLVDVIEKRIQAEK